MPKQIYNALEVAAAAGTPAAAPLRNIVNEPELGAWIAELATEKLGTPEQRAERAKLAEKWLTTVGRKAMLRDGLAGPYTPARGETPPEWAQKALSNGADLHRLALSASERQRMGEALDWLLSDQGPAVGSDWSKVSHPQAELAARAWIGDLAEEYRKQRDSKRLAAKAQGPEALAAYEAALAAGTQDIPELSDLASAQRPGWKWVQLLSADALSEEGMRMRHCVGSYWRAVSKGERQIYSLRDTNNDPQMTVETRGETFIQFQIRMDRRVPPELWPAALALIHWRCPDPEQQERAALRLKKERDPEEGLQPHIITLDNAIVGRLEKGAPLNAEQLAKVEQWKARREPEESAWELAFSDAVSTGSLSFTQALMPDTAPGKRPEWMAPDSPILSLAILSGSVEVLDLLLPHFELDPSDALIRAVESGSEPMLTRLLPLCDPRANDCEALREAINLGFEPIALALLPACLPLPEPLPGVPFKKTDVDDCAAGTPFARVNHIGEAIFHAYGDSPFIAARMLVGACESSNARLAEFLLPHALRARQSETLPAGEAERLLREAFQEAAKDEHPDLLNLLLPHMDPLAHGSEALTLAASNGRVNSVRLLLPLSHPAQEERGARALDAAAKSAAAANRHWDDPLSSLSVIQKIASEIPALSQGSEALIQMLSLNEQRVPLTIKDKVIRQLLPLADPVRHIGPALINRAAAGDEARARELLLILDRTPGAAQSSLIASIKTKARQAAVDGGSDALHMALAGHGTDQACSAEALEKALAKGSWKLADRILDEIPDHEKALAGSSALLAATQKEVPLPLIERLLEFCDPLANGSKPLELAVKCGRADLAALLLPLSDLSLCGAEALRSACAHGRKELVELLLPSLSSGQVGHNAFKSNAFRDACRADHWEIAKIVLPTLAPSERLSEALALAAGAGRMEMVELLLPRSDPMDDESAALRAAVKFGHLEIAQRLLPLSDPMGKRSEALRTAVTKKHVALTELLAPVSDVNAHACEALRKACNDGELEIMQALIPRTDPARAERIIKDAGFEDEGEAMLLSMIKRPASPTGRGSRP